MRVYNIHKLLSKVAKEVRAINRALPRRRGDDAGTSWYYNPLPSKTKHQDRVWVFFWQLKIQCTHSSHHLSTMSWKNTWGSRSSTFKSLKDSWLFHPMKLKTVVHQEENKLSMGCKVILLILKLWYTTTKPIFDHLWLTGAPKRCVGRSWCV